MYSSLVVGSRRRAPCDVRRATGEASTYLSNTPSIPTSRISINHAGSWISVARLESTNRPMRLRDREKPATTPRSNTDPDSGNGIRRSPKSMVRSDSNEIGSGMSMTIASVGTGRPNRWARCAATVASKTALLPRSDNRSTSSGVASAGAS